jgi:hypothetical protein
MQKKRTREMEKHEGEHVGHGDWTGMEKHEEEQVGHEDLTEGHS